MELNVQHLDFIQLLNIFEMCQRQERTRKLIVYQLYGGYTYYSNYNYNDEMDIFNYEHN